MDTEKPDTLWLDELNISHPHARAFLLAFAECGNISRASRAAQWTRERHYQMLTAPTPDAPYYADAFLEAKRRAIEVLESAATDRAVFGVPRPIYQNGRKVGEERVYSDNLLNTLLKANDRAKYGDKQEISGPNGGPLVMATVSMEELDARIASLLGKAHPPIELIPPGASPQLIEGQSPAAGAAQVVERQGDSEDSQNANAGLKKIEPGPISGGVCPPPSTTADGAPDSPDTQGVV